MFWTVTISLLHGLSQSVQLFFLTLLFALPLGLVVAFVTSVLSIKFLMGYIQKHDFGVFGWYRIALAVVVLVAVFGFGLDPAAA